MSVDPPVFGALPDLDAAFVTERGIVSAIRCSSKPAERGALSGLLGSLAYSKTRCLLIILHEGFARPYAVDRR